MDLQTITILILTGMAAGILGGMVGVGGGIIIVPALVYFLGFSQHTAQGTSLGLILLPVGILGFIQYYNSCKTTGQPINFTVIGILALGFIIGSFWGSKLAISLPQETVKKVFAVLMIIVAIKMMFFDKKETTKTTTINNEENITSAKNNPGGHNKRLIPFDSLPLWHSSALNAYFCPPIF